MKIQLPHRVALAAAVLCLAACTQDSPTETTAATDDTASAALPVAMELGPTLLAYHWRLESAADSAGQAIAALFPGPENRLGLEFASGRLGVTGGCNRIGAGFQLVEVSRLQLGPATSTMMGCPPPLAAADEAIASFLSGTLRAELQGDAGAPVLRLAAVDGRVLDFKGTPTPETRFGGPGTLAFLEVSPEPCEAPAASATCLKVRDRNFDEHGLRSGEPGEWRALPGGIEGYATSPGQQEVVRVKRFETAGAEPGVHFVFDMVVESVTVQ
jgi:heat shock protein HslJ